MYFGVSLCIEITHENNENQIAICFSYYFRTKEIKNYFTNFVQENCKVVFKNTL